MLAGVGGIDHALLVVACDDGVMAQTREHLAILQLTGNPQLTVALTKADRVDEARIDEVRQEVLAALSEYGFKDVALFVTVATEGRGIDALRNHLQQIPSREQASHHRFRLAIDRAFTVKGAGLVVTGTALSGKCTWAIPVAHGREQTDARARASCAKPAGGTGPRRAAYRAEYCR